MCVFIYLYVNIYIFNINEDILGSVTRSQASSGPQGKMGRNLSASAFSFVKPKIIHFSSSFWRLIGVLSLPTKTVRPPTLAGWVIRKTSRVMSPDAASQIQTEGQRHNALGLHQLCK